MNKPCEYNRYPHTDINVQNLDWIIEQINDLNHTVDVFTTLNKLTWAGEWNIGEAYSQWSLVNDLEGNGYVSIVPVPRNVQITNTDYWQPVAKYDSLYQAFEERIAALENFNNIEIPKIEANIQNNTDNIELVKSDVTNNQNQINDIINRMNLVKDFIEESGGVRVGEDDWSYIKLKNGQVIATVFLNKSVDFNAEAFSGFYNTTPLSAQLPFKIDYSRPFITSASSTLCFPIEVNSDNSTVNIRLCNYERAQTGVRINLLVTGFWKIV